MTYENIDGVINKWASAHHLSVFTESKGYEVRSIHVVGSDGKSYQLWIDAPTRRGVVAIHAWDHKKTRLDYTAPVEGLEAALEFVYAAVVSWAARGEATCGG